MVSVKRAGCAFRYVPARPVLAAPPHR